MRNLQQKSHEVDEFSPLLPTSIDSEFNLIGIVQSWLISLLLACSDFKYLIKCRNDLTAIRSFSFGKHTNMRKFSFCGVNPRTDLGITITTTTRQAGVIADTQATTIESLEEIYRDTKWAMFQETIEKCKYPMGLVLLVAVLLFHPLGSMLSYAGIDRQLELSSNSYNDNSTNQGYSEIHSELFNSDFSAVSEDVNELLINNSEIRIDSNLDSLSPSIDLQNPIKLAQSATVATFNIAESEITKTATEPFGAGNQPANVVFTFTIPGGSTITDKAFTISRDGTSTAATNDFGSLPTNPMLSSTNLTLTIPITGDDLDENEEKLILNLTFASSVNAQFKVGSMTATKSIQVTINITDTDSEPQLTANYDDDTISVAKGIGTFELEYQFSARLVSGRNITIGYTVNSANTDLENTDYSINGNLTATSGSVTLFAGQTKISLPITIISDNITQSSEDLALDITFTNAVYTFARVTTQSLVISVVDKPSISVETIYSEVHQDDYFEFTVSANPAPSQNQTITVGFDHQDFSDVRTSFTDDVIPPAVLTASAPKKVIRVEFLDNGHFNIFLKSGSDYVINFVKNSVGATIRNANFPAVNLGTIPTISKTDLNFDIAVQHDASGRTEDLPVRFIITNTGSQNYLKNRTSGDVEPFDIPAAGSKNVTIDLERSFAASGDGQITIRILPGAGYKLGTNATRVITVPAHDNPIIIPPEISISSTAAGATGIGVTEGYSFDFIVYSDSRVKSNFNVTISVTGSGGSGTLQPTLQGGGTTVTIPNGMQNVSATVVMASGANVPPAGGTITVAIVADGSRYTILNNTQSISVTVKDSSTGSAATPVVSLTGPAAVVESRNATYMVAASHTPSSAPLAVSIKIENQTGDFLATGQANEDTASITTHTTPDTIEVRTKADIPDGDAGIIKVTLLEGAGYALPATQNSLSVSTRVVDAVLSITSDQSGGVARGDDLFFTVTLDPPPSTPQPFVITAKDDNGAGANHLVFPSTVEVGTNGMATGRVRVNASGNNNIVVNINESSYPDFTINPLSLNLLPAVTLPEISIAKGTDFVVEGDEGSFTLTTSALPSADINVEVIFNVEGNFIATSESNLTKAVTFTPNGNLTQSVTFATKTDNPDTDDNGLMTATLVAGPGYNLSDTSTNRMASIAILDDDILLNILPTTLNEGDTGETGKMRFMVTTYRPVTSQVTATWTTSVENEDTATAGSDFINATGIVTIAVGESTGTFEVDIIGDDTSEPDETFTVTLSNASGDIKISDSARTAKGKIINDDGSILSISIAEAIEGSFGNTTKMLFTVTAIPPAPLNKSLSATWSTTVESDDTATAGSDFTNNNGNVTITAGAATGTFQVDILDDSERERIETFTVTLSKPSEDAQISSKAGSTKGIIIDNDFDTNNPRVSIKLASDSNSVIDEGDSFAVNISTEMVIPTAGNSIDVAINVNQQNGNYIAFRIPRLVRLTNADNSKTIDIHTIDDSIVDGEGKIIVSISGDENGYSIGQTFVVINVNADNDGGQTSESRISVAHTAVDRILTFLNPPQGSSPPITNAESSPIMTAPVVSITAVDNQVDEGTSARFLIASSNGAESTSISVSFQVEHLRVQVVLPSSTEIQIGGQETVSIAIPTINDNHANEDGYVAVSLLDNPDYQISDNEGRAVVSISDAVDRQNRVAELTANAQAFIPDLTGTMGANSLVTVSNRIELGFTEGGNQVLELGGRNSIPGILTASGDAVNEDTTTLKSFLGNSSFVMTLNSGDEFAIPTTLWGLGDYQKLSHTRRSRDSIDWSGDLFTGHIGIDALIQERLLAGISASVAESEVEFESTLADEIQFNSRTTSLNPYLGWTSKDQNSELQATFGIGHGELEIIQESYDNEILDSESYSFGLTGNQVLFTTDQIFAGTTRLNIKGDSWFAYRHIAGRDGILADFHTNTHHIRIRTEGVHQYNFATGSTLSPTISFGMRNDVKDHQSVLGLEVISGANYSNPIGVTVSGNGSMLIGAANQVQKIELESSLIFDRGRDQRGIIAEVAPSWGQVDSSIQNTLWNSNSLDLNFETGHYSNDASLNSEFGYGIEILQGDGLITPISGFEISSNQDYEYLIGTRLGLGANANFELSGIQSINSIGDIINKVRIKGGLSW